MFGKKVDLTQEGIFMALIQSSGFANFVRSYNTGITVLLTICTTLVTIALILSIVKLAGSSSSPMERRMGRNGVLGNGICLACLGGIDFIYAIVWRLVLGG